jgi:uncharacterized protein (DUF305 family)
MFGTYQRLGLHVSASNISVVRASRLVIAEYHRNTPEMREQRKQFYRMMIDYHRQARAVYQLAMCRGSAWPVPLSA